MPTNSTKTFRYEKDKERRVKLVFSQPTRTRPSFFSIEESDSLEKQHLVSFRKKDAKIGIGKGKNLILLWLRTSLFLGQA